MVYTQYLSFLILLWNDEKSRRDPSADLRLRMTLGFNLLYHLKAVKLDTLPSSALEY